LENLCRRAHFSHKNIAIRMGNNQRTTQCYISRLEKNAALMSMGNTNTGEPEYFIR
jgi:hypothetical protein